MALRTRSRLPLTARVGRALAARTLQFLTAPSKFASRTTSSITSSRSNVSRANGASVPCRRASFNTWLISESSRSISRSNPVQLTREVGGRLARQPQRDAHSGERRTQLVRDVAQQLRDGAAIGPQLIRHGVEIARQHREFVPASLESRAHAQPALARTSSFSEASARAPSWMRRMGALKCCASHQLVSAVTTSAMQRWPAKSPAGSTRRRCWDAAAPTAR